MVIQAGTDVQREPQSGQDGDQIFRSFSPPSPLTFYRLGRICCAPDVYPNERTPLDS